MSASSPFLDLRTKLAFLLIVLAVQTATAQFVHPGGLHTLADLERMRTNVLAGNSPWIEDWQQLMRNPQAQSNWKHAERANLGDSRQRADLDAHAAYLNALRWYISGDTNHAECAVRICNAWSASINQVPSGGDIPGLSGIPIFNFALAGELLRVYPRWKQADFSSFTNMMVKFFYPQCHGFLVNHAGRCDSFFWANWDACNIGALLAIGVLCDDANIFNEGVDYFKYGKGMGSISNAVPFLYPDGLGQWQESGRDQEHAQLGVGLLGSACQVAWNQGVDLFGYADNRLLAGAEYVAKCNLSYPASEIPFTFYNNCSEARQPNISINGLGRLDRPVWELIYNHYVVRRGLSAPYSTALAKLMRPEHGNGDHFGYGTLTFTLNAAASPYPPNPIPSTPTGLKAEAGVAQVFLSWKKSPDDTAQGYVVSRATNADGPFKVIASWKNLSLPEFTDRNVSNGVNYFYVVAATNQSGISGKSTLVSAQPLAAGTLPSTWSNAVIGKIKPATAAFSTAGENTFVIAVTGGKIGVSADELAYLSRYVTNNFVFVARLLDTKWSGRDKVGLMVRAANAPDAQAIALTLGETGGRQCRLGSRLRAGAKMEWQAGCDYTWLPAWFKLERVGKVVTGYQSVDGVKWFRVGATTVELPPTCVIGLAVTRANTDASMTTTFDHVSVK